MTTAADHVEEILKRLYQHYPGATYELDWETPEQMLVATTLAAQCTDERVNRVTATLFKKYPNPRAFAEADFDELAEDLKPTGFYRQKAKSVQEINRALVDRFGGQVPRTMEALITLPGVARKTANVVLNCCFDLPTGIIVDTHVARLSQRMGLSHKKSPEAIEADLMELVPKPAWTFWGPAMVLHGRYVCTANKPACARCIYYDLCERRDVTDPRPATWSPPAPPAPSAAPPVAASPAEVEVEAQTLIIDPWVEALADALDTPQTAALLRFVEQERATHAVFPPREEVFSAFSLTPLDQVKVLILGQDPYHGPGQAHGLSFSVKPGIELPPSLKNIYKELESDLGIAPPAHGHLAGWATQGVLMLNAVLTVRQAEPNSHKDQGWEALTDAVIQQVSRLRPHVVFVLWGGYAHKKAALIDANKHTLILSAHPSPLSARNGFFGSRPFSRTNDALRAAGQAEIDWSAL
jgi:uracil-DNA glycosylase/endonuclease III